jgi:KDO2-lipid IV(A) lauroyltransferase
MRPPIRRYLLDPLEAALLIAVFGLLRLLPIDWASGVGGSIAARIGPMLKVSNVARRNLALAFPELGRAEIEALVRGVWNNLGRVAGEYPHLAAIARRRVELVGLESALAVRDDGKPGILFAGHLANWELLPMVASGLGIPLTLVYRAANNPLVDRVIARLRRAGNAVFLPKGPSGARGTLAAMRDGAHLAMLVDQKMNDGIAVPFFGITAMTAPALAQLAYRFDCPVLPARMERLGGAHFRLTVLPPLAIPHTGNRPADILAAMTAVNHLLEDWIRANPSQWLWLHKRWPGLN